MATRTHLLPLLVLPLWVLGVSCGDDATTLVQYQDDPSLEKVNCAGGAKCIECCNDGACAEGQACNAGSNAEDKVILFCDGPEDCDSGKVCCVKRSSGGALVGACTTVCNDGGAKACHVPNNCDGQQCTTFEPAPYIGTCDNPEEGQ
jgi:hypothetical protein